MFIQNIIKIKSTTTSKTITKQKDFKNYFIFFNGGQNLRSGNNTQCIDLNLKFKIHSF